MTAEAVMMQRDFPGGGRLHAREAAGALDELVVGPDVVIDVGRLQVGRGVQIGASDDEEAFRFPAGTRIRADELVLGDRVRIGRQVLVRGGRFELRGDCQIGHASTVKVSHALVIGEHGIVNQQCEIAGVDIVIGRELWMLPTAKIGGGSAFEVHSRLRAGHWLHLGMRTLVNTARPVHLGDEVGLGTGTSLYTHGAYPSALDGKPVAFGPITIGDRTWLPGAIVNPNVTIGSDCIIGVGSVVTRDVPSGALAAGVPAKILREGAFPRRIQGEERQGLMRELLQAFGAICGDRHAVEYREAGADARLRVDDTWIEYSGPRDPPRDRGPLILLTDDEAVVDSADDRVTIIGLDAKRVVGAATPLTERLLNQLRRYGIRFNVEIREGRYTPWT